MRTPSPYDDPRNFVRDEYGNVIGANWGRSAPAPLYATGASAVFQSRPSTSVAAPPPAPKQLDIVQPLRARVIYEGPTPRFRPLPVLRPTWKEKLRERRKKFRQAWTNADGLGCADGIADGARFAVVSPAPQAAQSPSEQAVKPAEGKIGIGTLGLYALAGIGAIAAINYLEAKKGGRR